MYPIVSLLGRLANSCAHFWSPRSEASSSRSTKRISVSLSHSLQSLFGSLSLAWLAQALRIKSKHTRTIYRTSALHSPNINGSKHVTYTHSAFMCMSYIGLFSYLHATESAISKKYRKHCINGWEPICNPIYCWRNSSNFLVQKHSIHSFILPMFSYNHTISKRWWPIESYNVFPWNYSMMFCERTGIVRHECWILSR